MSGGILAFIVFMITLWHSTHILVEVSDRQPIIPRQLTTLLLIALTVMMTTLRPYKSETANHIVVCLNGLLAAGASMCIWFDTPINNYIIFYGIVLGIFLLRIPHCVFYIYVLHHIWRKVNFKTIAGVCKKCRGKDVRRPSTCQLM